MQAFMDAAVLAGPIRYQRHTGEPADPPALLRKLYLGILLWREVAPRARFERATYCLGGTSRRSPGGAGRRRMCC